MPVHKLEEPTVSHDVATGWLPARVRVGATYPLIAVCAIRPSGDVGSRGPSQDETVEVARYAVELAQAMGKTGADLRRLARTGTGTGFFSIRCAAITSTPTTLVLSLIL